MPPTLRQLEAFTLVYRLGTVTQAASRMNLTQSTVSVLLRQLEHGVGTRLFDRTTRTLSPTEAAHQILPFAERSLREIDQMQQLTRSLLTKSHGRVRLATSAALAAASLPAVIAAFSARYPGVEIELHDVAPAMLNAMLLDRVVDFAVGGWPETTSPELEYAPVRTGFLVAARRRDAGVTAPTLTWEELAREPAVIGLRNASTIRKRIDRELLPLGLHFTPTLEGELLSTAIALTVEGMGVAVLPEDLIGALPRGVLTLQRLVRPEVRHDIVLFTRADVSLTPAAGAFVAVLRDVLGDPPA